MCVHFIGYDYIILSDTVHFKLLVIISSTLFHSCGNSEICIHHVCTLFHYQVYFKTLDTSNNCRIYTLVHSCRHGGEILHLGGEVLHLALTLHFIRYTFRYVNLKW